MLPGKGSIPKNMIGTAVAASVEVGSSMAGKQNKGKNTLLLEKPDFGMPQTFQVLCSM
jgi:hypothetical protein